MFLLIRRYLAGTFVLILIYIPLCFYLYVFLQALNMSICLDLHSTMFLLIQIPGRQGRTAIHHLHSTMFLLIPFKRLPSQPGIPHLHSTMFLLIRISTAGDDEQLFLFTFHYVSTYTCKSLWNTPDCKIYIPLCVYLYCQFSVRYLVRLHLHSTMFLLIRKHILTSERASSSFTFHYVSTYTIASLYSLLTSCNLHSTMFLLIPIFAMLCYSP